MENNRYIYNFKKANEKNSQNINEKKFPVTFSQAKLLSSATLYI